MSSTKPFDPDSSEYDLSTYGGRFMHFLDVINPLTLFASDESLSKAENILNSFDKQTGKSTLPGVTDRDLWEAKKLVSAVVHPDLKEKIWAPFRMSAFVPMNMPIVFGMLTANPHSIPQTVLWQWINQSYNVCVNYANRNASNEMPMQKVAEAYAGAVISSCTIAVGLGELTKRMTSLRSVAKFVPFLAVASAGALNVILMRYNEIENGIQVKDLQGNVVGSSKAAGKAAIAQVALTRVILPIPVLLLPPVFMRMVPLSLGKGAKMIVELGVISACLGIGLPIAISMFPQNSTIAAKDLEPEFHNLKDKDGKPIDTFVYNKGL
eukprot:TRINITY_DN5897_c0_g1_i1.p1 TRINITY_DN5897_c0_g1~~TRINITY_DN5897_c0_g1_i1.p1  ORF type:complete len:323 (-),score=90.04 TRINITY_DN5897_c0_g1_i1:21-989(-)